MTKLCSHCHQPLPEMRAGVRLSALKARIFDAIERAGSNGITIEDINAICFDGQASAVNVRNHIHQINGGEAESAVLDLASEGLGGEPHVAVRPLRRDAHKDVESPRPTRLRPPHQSHVVEHFPRDVGDGDDLRPVDSRHRIKVDPELVGVLEVIGPHGVRVEVQASKIHDPRQARSIPDDGLFS